MTDTQPLGKKFDSDKLRMDLIPPEVLTELAKILGHGANKYGENNWKALDKFDDRYYAAALRHLILWRSGELLDQDSGLSHLSHALANLAFLVWKERQE